MLAQRYQKKMLKCNKNNYKSTKRLIWSRHCLDASTAFLSGQCVYI